MVHRAGTGLRFSIAILATVLFLASFAFGQGIVTGSISGTVTDPTGAVIPGAKVTVKHLETNTPGTTVSNEAGLFTIRNLPPGTYSMTVEAPKFRKLQIGTIDVSVGKDTTLAALKLELGASSEVVEVTGAAPIIETSSAQISTTFDSKKVTDLPINNNFDSLALFVPGVASVGDAGFSNTNGVGFSSNGQRGRSNNFQLDGQSNNDNSIGGPSIFFGNQDAIAEVQIVTNYTAEYGRNSGSVVNYITKSGTNLFHGSAFEYYQGSFTDALINDEKSPLLGYCQPGEDSAATGCQEPKVARRNRNRFGGTLGGPIMKNKLWFFGSAQWDKVRNGGLINSSGALVTPTPNGLQTLATAFPNSPGVKALQAIGPTAVSAGNPVYSNASLFPVTDGVTTAQIEMAQVSRFVAGQDNDVQATGRVDWQISDKDRFFGRYIYQNTTNVPYTGVTSANFAAGAWVDIPARDQQIGLDWARTWTNNFVNQARFSYSRAGFGFEGGSFPGCLRSDITNCPTRIALTGAYLPFGLQTNMPQGRLINVYQVQDNASWLHGRHTFKFGGEYSKQRSPNVFLPTVNGQFTYRNTAAAGTDPAFTAFDNLIRGTTQSFTLTDGLENIPFKENDLAFYFQDDWRVAENLTLNFGLRWEWFQQAVNLLSDYTVERESDPATAFWDTSLPVSQRSVPRVPEDRNNVSPVFGFAWTPRIMPALFGDGKTVIRGGFRVSYDPSFYNMFLNVATATPTANSSTISAGAPPLPNGGSYMGTDIRAATLSYLPLGVDPGTRSQTFVSPTFHNPYTEQWSLGVQREITNKIVGEVRYVGNHSVGLFQTFNANPSLNLLISSGYGSLIPAGLSPCTDPTQPGFGASATPNSPTGGYADCASRNVLSRQNSASSNYHGLQTELRVSNWHGLSANVGYTYSRNIDNASEVYSTLAGGSTLSYSQNPFDINHAERAVSGISFPHVFTVGFIYELPFYKGQQGITGKMLGGWQTGVTHRYQSGQPYTLYQAKGYEGLRSLCDPTDTMSTAFDACRPIEINPSAPFDTVGACFDPTAPDCGIGDIDTGDPLNYSQVHWMYNDANAAQFFGTPFAGVSRNTARGETINNTNLSIYKNTKLTERFQLRFEATAFNVLNRQFLGNPDGEVDDIGIGSFGNTHYNTCGGETENGTCRRRLQFGLKLTF